MGLNTLTNVLEKKGQEYLDQFLNENVIITEKLDTYRISFGLENGKLKFFKKDNSEINLIERTLTDIWEKAIIEIPTLIEGLKLPEGVRFGIAYTPVERPIRLPYSNLPPYILTDVIKRKNNKSIEVFDYTEVNEWAKLMNIGRPPIIFEGILSEKQKNVLINYDKRLFDDIDENFSFLIESQIGKTYSGENTIEGIIIKSNDKLAQVVSYEFELLNEAYQKKDSPRDFYDLVLIHLNSFLDSHPIPVMEADDPNQAYINIICNIYNGFCENTSITENLNPKFLTPPRFGHSGSLNLKFIQDKKTKEILKGGKIFEALFRVVLSSFRKYKRSYGLLTEALVDNFNTHVYMINYNSNIQLELNEHYHVNEEKISEARSDNVVVQSVNRRQNTDIDNMRVIASIQKAFEPKPFNIRQGDEKCVIYICDMTPFTKIQMENLLAINKAWNLPVIIIGVSDSRKIKGEKFILSDNLIQAELQSIAQFNKEIVPAFLLIDSWDLNEIFEYTRPKYEPVALITDQGKKSEFVLQLYFEDEIMGGRLGVEDNFNIGEISAEDKLIATRSIEDKLFYTFKENTSQAIWGLWDNIKTEYQIWSGELLIG